MLRLAAALLAKKKKPLPASNGGRGASRLQRISRPPVRKRTPSPGRRSAVAAVERAGSRPPSASALDNDNKGSSTAVVAHKSTEVVSATGTPALVADKKPPYCLATAVSTIVVPPSVNHLLEEMKQTLTPSLQRPNDVGVANSSSEEGRGPVSQMEEFYTPKKGPLFATAVIAGTNAVKQASQLIPFCHPMRIQKCSFTFRRRIIAGLSRTSSLPHRVVLRKRTSPPPPPSRARSECSVLYCFCTVATDDIKTGVEIEALTGASVAALTLYDMLKGLSGAQEDGLGIGESFVLAKRGGKNDFTKLLMSEPETPTPLRVETAGLLTQGQTEDVVVAKGDKNDDDDNGEKGETETVADMSAAVGVSEEADHIASSSPSLPQDGAAEEPAGDCSTGGVNGEDEHVHSDTLSRIPAVSDPESAKKTVGDTAGDKDVWWRSSAREKRMQQLYPRRRYEDKRSSTTRRATPAAITPSPATSKNDVGVMRKEKGREALVARVDKEKRKVKMKVTTARRAPLGAEKKRAAAPPPMRPPSYEESDDTGDDDEDTSDAVNSVVEEIERNKRTARAARGRPPAAFSAATEDEDEDVAEHDRVERASFAPHKKKTLRRKGNEDAERVRISSSHDNSNDEEDSIENVDDPYDEPLGDVERWNEVEELPPLRRQPRVKTKDRRPTSATPRSRHRGTDNRSSHKSPEKTMLVEHDTWDNGTEIEYEYDQAGDDEQNFFVEEEEEEPKKEKPRRRQQQQHRGNRTVRSSRPQRQATRR